MEFSFVEGEMDLTAPETPLAIWATLADKLADSLVGAIPPSTPRQVHGAVTLPGKATAVVGMRRAGKTTFLHQLRDALTGAAPSSVLPLLQPSSRPGGGSPALQVRV